MIKIKPFSIFIMIGLWFGQPDVTFAHAVVTEYSLSTSPIHANRPNKVVLSFNSKIEIGLSQIFLVRKGDIHELLHVVAGKKRGEVLIDIPPLDAGDYALSFKIFAADGHLTEDVIRFSVSPNKGADKQVGAQQTK